MGYKTTDLEEKERLQKQGYSVIGISSTMPQEFEFNFTKEDIKPENLKVVATDTPITEEPPREQKKRGRKPGGNKK